jgi:hypothetical protein
MNEREAPAPDAAECLEHDWVPGAVHLRKTGAAVTYHCTRCAAVSYNYGDTRYRSNPSGR